MHYPNVFPVEAIQTLVTSMAHKDKADKKAVAAGYELLGYALGQFIGEPGQNFGLVEDSGFNGTLGRDPKKEKQIQQQVMGYLSLAYGAAMFSKDVGIPAVLLALNGMIMANWPNLAEAYWSAKGM